jgi:alcohol dehydrogenase (cytochrome c)/quinohemoprotein ethanol dehydrogenase
MSYSPLTGLVYIPAKQEPLVYFLEEGFKPRNLGVNLGINLWDIDQSEYSLGIDYLPEVQGRLLAWDPVEQREVWRAPQPGSHNGGMLSTAGNLLLQGNADAEFVAYRATDGERLWSAEVQSGVTAPPVSYAVDGVQYIAVVVGWGSSSALLMGEDLNPDGDKRNISRVLAFKLDGDAELPAPPPLRAKAEPPAAFGDELLIEEGSLNYAKNCLGCHGIVAVSGGVISDLRFSPILATAAGWDAVVRGGRLREQGMVSFAENLTESQSEAVRAYVVQRAHETKQ